MCQNSYKIFPVYVRVNHCEYNASRYTLPQICCMLLSLIGHFLITALQYYPFCLARKKNSQVLEYCLNLQRASKSVAEETAENVPLGSAKIKVVTDSLQHQCQACYQRLWVSTITSYNKLHTSHQKEVHTLAPGFR